MGIMRYLGEAEEVTIPKEIHGQMVSTSREDAFAQNRELRRVYLPEGLWRDYWTKEPVKSGWLEVTTENIPVFEKGTSL